MTDPYAVPGGAPYPAGTSAAVPAMPPTPRAVRGLAVALAVLLGVCCLVLMVRIAGLAMRAAWVDRLVAREVVDDDRAMLLDGVVVAATIGYIVMLIATGIVFMVWQYRHAKNARLLGQEEGLGPGWAIGGWFVPLANLVLPAVQIFGSSRYSVVRPDDRGRPRGAGIVIAWAITFGLGELTTRVAARGEPQAGTAEYAEWLSRSDREEAVGAVILLAAGILAAIMVWTLTKRQDTALARVLPMLQGGYATSAYSGQQPWQQPIAPQYGQQYGPQSAGYQPPSAGGWTPPPRTPWAPGGEPPPAPPR